MGGFKSLLAIWLVPAAAVPDVTGLSWSVVRDGPSKAAFDGAHRETTYRSTPIQLDPGRVILTPPRQMRILMPPEPAVITSLRLEVVRAKDGAPVPLTEVYNHHVVFYGGGGKIGADVCGGAHLDMLDGFWGVGAEARGTVTELPEGFAFPGEGPWLANIHLIRSEGVPNVKRCIECACPGHGGSEDCCPHLSVCPGFPEGAVRNESDVKDYAVQYTVGWSPKVDLYRPVRYMTLDATGCQLEFQVPSQCPWMWRHDNLHGRLPSAKGLRGSGRELPSDFSAAAHPPAPGCTARVAWDYALPDGSHGVEVLFSKGHMHIGGLNASVYVLRREGGEPELLCASSAKYGSSEGPGSAGDELGYVTGMSHCLFSHKRPVLRKGDRLRAEAVYRTDLWFHGVMGLVDLAVVPVTKPES